MGFLTERDIATLFLDGSAIVLTLSVLVLSLTYKKKNCDEDRYFYIMLITNCVLTVGDTLGCVFEMKTTYGSGALRTLGMTIFFMGVLLISMIWTRYCRIRFKNRGISKNPDNLALFIPGILVMVLIFVNLFTGVMCSYNERGEFETGILFIVFHIVVIAYIVIGFSHLARYRGRVSGMRLIPIWLFVFLGAVGVEFTFIDKNSASFVPICLAMALTFIHMGTINEVLALSYKKTVS